MDSKATERIEGTVEKITFHNIANGFTVFDLNNQQELICVVGCFAQLNPGEDVVVYGNYEMHPTFGPQFKAVQLERKFPTSSAAVLRYLSYGGIKGIGPATAAKIVDKFGEATLEIIEKEPLRLSSIKGISKSKAIKISEEFIKQFGMREVMIFLSQYNISPDEALNIYKKFGVSSIDRIKANPFCLCGDDTRFSFERAEEIAEDLGFKKDFSFRIIAGIEYVLRHNLSNGHTCIPFDKLTEIAVALLGVDNDTVTDTCNQMISGGNLCEETISGRRFVFLSYMHRAEKHVAQRMKLASTYPPATIGNIDRDIEEIERSSGIKYEKLQKEAIKAALTKGILILTGGPGTGKTTTLNAIIHIFERQELKIALAAPTGRAAKRMTELTGMEAKTIHRLLEVEWNGGAHPVFIRNEQNPLDCQAIIIDELSMVDIMLFDSLLRALPLGCRIILVGDSDQLPSVGAGNVLQDLIESGVLPTIELKEVFRQAMQSLIITNAHKIVSGEKPILNRNDSDFFFMNMPNPVAAANKIRDLVVKRLPAAYSYSPLSDIQVLCPSRKKELGTANINSVLQEHLNPRSEEKREIKHGMTILREGDKVMQIKNNYDIIWDKDDGSDGSGIFNGDIGILESISRSNDSVKVRFDDKVATYSGDEIEQLELAYAITVHKSQGSEFECVVLPVADMPPQLKYRNLLYTAVTRAKKLLVVIGSEKALMDMVANNKRTKRYTALKKMLEEER